MLWRTRSGVPLGTLREGGCQTPSDPEGGEEENLLFLSTKHAQGTGMLTEQGFLLQKGSRLRPEELKSCANNVRSLRAQLRADGSVSEDNVLTRDVLFSSPSFAAGFLNGSSADGNSMWHTRNGTVLGALRESPVSDNPEAEPEPADPQTSPEEPQLPPEHLKLHLSSRTLSAFGYQTEEGFIVLQGSTVHPTESPGCPDSVRKLRASMVQDGTIQNCVLTKDVTFSSPSTAATVLRGSRCSGLTVWLDDNGVPLGTLIKNTPGSDT